MFFKGQDGRYRMLYGRKVDYIDNGPEFKSLIVVLFGLENGGRFIVG